MMEDIEATSMVVAVLQGRNGRRGRRSK
jgi:hypothetical protein